MLRKEANRRCSLHNVLQVQPYYFSFFFFFYEFHEYKEFFKEYCRKIMFGKCWLKFRAFLRKSDVSKIWELQNFMANKND